MIDKDIRSSGYIPFNGIVGIDLGTTNSCVSIVQNGEAKIIENNFTGERTTPSVVDFSEMPPRVGKDALIQATRHPKLVIRGSKRVMGLRYDAKENSAIINKMKSYAGYDIINHEGYVGIMIEGKNGKRPLYPMEVAAEILRYLKKTVINYLHCDPSQEIKAVITVPAYFDDAQKKATKEAGKLAGFDVVRIMQEPTAAILAYTKSKSSESKVVIVYDLGGGTFDVSAVSITAKDQDDKDDATLIEVLATKGDAFLGGEDFDKAIIDHLITDINNKIKKGDLPKIDLTDPMLLQRLRDVAEDAKKALSSTEIKSIELPYIAIDPSTSRPFHYSYKLSEIQLRQMCDSLIQKTKPICDSIIKDAKEAYAKKSPGETFKIGEIILVGGMTRMKAVRDFVEKTFGKAPRQDVNPDEAVAQGAAIQGAIMKGGDDGIKDILVIDVTPLSLGIETLGGVFTRIVSRNSSIPIKQSQVFSTAGDNQTQVGIRVFQGEREMANDNKLLGEFSLHGIPPAPRGVPEIEVTFEIDQNCIVTVSARDKRSGKSQSLSISQSNTMSKDEAERLVKEAETFKEVDKELSKLAENLSRAETRVYTAEKGKTDFEKSDKLVNRISDELVPAIEDSKGILEKVRTEFDTLKAELSQNRMSNHSKSLDKQVSETKEQINSITPSFEELEKSLKKLDDIVMSIGQEFRESKDSSDNNNSDNEGSNDDGATQV